MVRRGSGVRVPASASLASTTTRSSQLPATSALPGLRRLDHELRDPGLESGVLEGVALDLEDPLRVSGERERRRLARRRLLLDLVAMEVDRVGLVRRHDYSDGVALLHLDRARACLDFVPCDLDARHVRLLRGPTSPTAAAAGSRSLSDVGAAFVAVIVAARIDDHKRDYGHHDGGRDEPESLTPGDWCSPLS